MTLKEIVKDKVVRFQYYRDRELWYQTEDGFSFPIKAEDAGTGTFKAEDKAIFFMRWIRKHLDEMKTWDTLRGDPKPGSTCGAEEVGAVKCEVCDGTGMLEPPPVPDEECYECNGTGVILPLLPNPPMSEAGRRIMHSILTARIPEENILRFNPDELDV